MKKNVIVTGVAGFIGSKIASRLIDLNYKVLGLMIYLMEVKKTSQKRLIF